MRFSRQVQLAVPSPQDSCPLEDATSAESCRLAFSARCLYSRAKGGMASGLLAGARLTSVTKRSLGGQSWGACGQVGYSRVGATLPEVPVIAAEGWRTPACRSMPLLTSASARRDSS